MKKMTRILALLLAVVMLCGLCACAKPAEQPPAADEAGQTDTPPSAASDEPAREGKITVHPGQAPLVDEPVTLRVAVLCHDSTTAPEETWMYKYIEEVLGINIELEYFYTATRDESVSLMMADGDLPDVMIALELSSDEIAKFGEAEGMLLDIKPYLTEEYAPNLCAVYAEYPEFLTELTTPTGHVYSIGGIEYDSVGFSSYRMFYNYDMIEAMGYTDVPRTLDEFVQMLRDMKQYGLDNGLDIIPLGGNYARYNPTYLIMNALGYNISMDYSNQKSHETDIAVRNGQVVLPAYDREAFPTYLETMHTIYSEGLMEQDFYTLEKDTCKAHLSSGMYGVFSEVPGLYGGDEFGRQWWGAIPMTSAYNDTPFWPNYTSQRIGEFAISADTEYPELCVALADYFYMPSARLLPLFGPNINQPDIQLGFDGWYTDPETKEKTYADYLAHADEYEAINYYVYAKYNLWMSDSFVCAFDSDELDENGNSTIKYYNATGDTVMEVAQYRKSNDLASFNDQWKASQQYTLGSYRSDVFSPSVTYFDEETNARIAELKTLIDDYATQEIAKFIIGERDLSEIDDYFNELQALGADEYVQHYADYYASQNS